MGEPAVQSVTLTPPPSFPFDDDCRNTAGTRWPIWLSNFEDFLAASGIQNEGQSKSLLLYTIGSTVKEIFLATCTGAETFEEAKTLLTNYFAPLQNTEYEIFTLGKMLQTDLESVDDFTVRLRRHAARCGFARAAVDGEVKKQLIAGIRSTKLRNYILETPGITLAQILTKARALQVSTMYSKQMADQMNIKTEPISAIRRQFS